jgi:hypothetical protein
MKGLGSREDQSRCFVMTERWLWRERVGRWEENGARAGVVDAVECWKDQGIRDKEEGSLDAVNEVWGMGSHGDI